MTTVAAVARDGVVAMAADSMTCVYDRPINTAQKIIRVRVGERRPYGELLLGLAGDGALLPLLATCLEVKTAPDPGDEAAGQVWAGELARTISRVAADHGLVEDGRMDSLLLLGWSGRLWTLCHMQAIFHVDGVAAVGSGEGPAVGAIDLLLAGGADPAQAVTGALSVAIARDKNSDGPIHVQVLGAAGG